MTITAQNPNWQNIHNISKIEVLEMESLQIGNGIYCRKICIAHCDDRGENAQILQLDLFSKSNDVTQLMI